MGPLADDHPSIGNECSACQQPLKAGDYVTLVVLGPGDDDGARAAAREGRPYNAVAAIAHWVCVTGKEE
jgi:hypothetical protein